MRLLAFSMISDWNCNQDYTICSLISLAMMKSL